jgi:hypothetical protein
MKRRQLTCTDHGGRGRDPLHCPECEQEFEEELRLSTTPIELDLIVDVVMAYKPKPKTEAARKRVRKAKRDAKTDSGS